MAMVIPDIRRGGPWHDRSLRYVAKWAEQWKRHEPCVRHLEYTKMWPTARLPRSSVSPKHFEDVIDKVVKAAKIVRPYGVVALTLGHGHQGGSDSNPFFNFACEDKKGTKSKLHIDQNLLLVPSGTEKHNRNALIKLGKELQKIGLRRFLLHTCNVGNAKDFTQLVADLMGIPVLAHKDYIIYEGAKTEDVKKYPGNEYQAAYENADLLGNPRPRFVIPRAMRQWPVTKLTQPAFPTK
jgi:hypothetical protein